MTQAVIREVREETGLHVEVERLTGVYSDPAVHVVATYPDGSAVQYVNLSFLCRATGGALQVSGEGLEVGFFSLRDLPEPFLLGHRIRLDDAVSGREGPTVR